MRTHYFCHYKGRVNAVRALGLSSPSAALNGIEYLEVAPDQKQLQVHFVHPLDTVSLSEQNVEIRGGVRVVDPRVTHVSAWDNVLTVDVDRAGDFSRYRLRLVRSAAEDRPPEGIDEMLSEVEFSFKVDCPSDFDCRTTPDCPPAVRTEPVIDYLARDYTSFRRVMLDRLSTLLPAWQERNAADAWIALVEAIAFRADELSYYQDAVATEAYLGTARTRISVRRHARLLDYPFHDGSSARVWVAFGIDPAADGIVLPGCDPASGLGGTPVVTASGPAPADAEARWFETLHPIRGYAAHNTMRFYTWSDEHCCLPKGATRAFLRDDGASGRLRLQRGDVLILEERVSSETGLAADADRTRRHAVRLTVVDPAAPIGGDGGRAIPAPRIDELTGTPFVEVRWDAADALPFPLCVSTPTVPDAAIATGNVALADHGRTLPRASEEDVGEPAGRRAVQAWRPLLAQTAHTPLTQQARVRPARGGAPVLVDSRAPASAAFTVDPSDVRPAIEVREGGQRWVVRRDLLSSGRFASEFVVETEDDGRAYIRFGDGIAGRRPRRGASLQARYRLGTGRSGNIGADALARLGTAVAGVTGVRNPLPARGGADPHPIATAKLYAPEAFRRQERAVTTGDYQRVAERYPGVQRAAATRRWTGSWHTTFVTVDRTGGRPVDRPFDRDLTQFLDRYRLAGHDIEIDAPRFVPLDIALEVCADAGHFAADVKERLLSAFSTRRSSAGGVGFFHPDRFTFGTPVYVSAIVARAMKVPGVASVAVARFHRFGRIPGRELADGVIPIGRLEIARLENDPNAPEQGRLDIDVRGGL